jgi:hypothetical protein
MLSDCVKLVQRLGIRLGKISKLTTKSTALIRYLTNQVFLVRGFYTFYGQLVDGFEQVFATGFNLLIFVLGTLPTGSTNNTNLIKDCLL